MPPDSTRWIEAGVAAGERDRPGRRAEHRGEARSMLKFSVVPA